MTKEECVKIMAILGAFYSGGKNDPRVQAQAWYLILEKYPYAIAERAVLHFAENDNREYATFPTVGRIVTEIKAEEFRIRRPINEIVKGIHYGRSYDQLSDDAIKLISNEMYDEWLAMDAEEFSQKTDVLSKCLENHQKMLIGSCDGQDK